MRLANCQSNLFNTRHFPSVETNYWTFNSLESGVFYVVGFNSVVAVVRRVIQLNDCFYCEIRLADNKVHVFTAYFVELRLPCWVFLNANQGGHCDLGENYQVGHGFRQSVKQYLFGVAKRYFSEVRRSRFFVGAFVSCPISLRHFDEDYDSKSDQSEKNQSFHCFSPFSFNKSGDCKP